MEFHDGEGANLLGENDDQQVNLTESVNQIVLKWENLEFSIDSREGEQKVLKGVSGFSNPGEILAIMGSSGSGKTSLISILSNQMVMQSNFKIRANIWLNSQKYEDLDTSNLIGYIPQENIVHEFLTPYEFLKFNLTLKAKETKENIEKRVKNTLERFKLTTVQHSIIGGVMVKGLSGGEKKRVVIASEVILNPSILILDEPTSGLDSYISKTVMNVLKSVSLSGVNVIITIHQPGSEIFRMFDRLALMQEGRLIYQGKALDSIEYFKSVGLPVPNKTNPPDHYMKILYIEDRHNLSEKEKNLMELLYKKYDEIKDKIWDEINEECINTPVINTKEEKSIGVSLKIVLLREVLNYQRNPINMMIKLSQVFIYIILIDLIFNNLGYDDQGVDDRRGLIIFLLMIGNFIPAFSATLNLASERTIVHKELISNLYSLKTYFLSKAVLELPLSLVVSVLMVFPIYYAADLNQESSDRVFIFLLIFLMTYLNSFCIGLLSGALSSSLVVAPMLGGAVSINFFLLSGFFSDPESPPDAINWLRFLNPYFFLRNAAFENEFDDLDLDDDVYFEPEDRYNYDGGVWGNISITLIHLVVIFLFSMLIYYIQVRKTRVFKN